MVSISFATLLLNSYLSTVAPDGERLSAVGKKMLICLYLVF